MASVVKAGVKWRAHIYVSGVRRSKVLRTQREAIAWAAAHEVDLRRDAALTDSERYTLADAIARYLREVSPRKRGHRWELIRGQRFLDDVHLPTSMAMADLTPAHLSAWRDSRSSAVSAGTVLREIGFLSAIIESARRDWGWIGVNPLRDVRKPSAPMHRQTVMTRAQIRLLLRSMGYAPRSPVRSVGQRAALCLLLALRTGMRAGELCGLSWDRVHPDFCRLAVTKTVPRDVPVTAKTRRLLAKARGIDAVSVLRLKAASLDTLFRRHRDRCGIDGVKFHDSRHTAATWLARRLDVLDLCKMLGWSNPKMAMTYYNPTARDIARRIEGRLSK